MGKNYGKLVKKIMIDKNGKRKTVWVKANADQKKSKPTKQVETKEKQGKLTDKDIHIDSAIAQDGAAYWGGWIGKENAVKVLPYNYDKKRDAVKRAKELIKQHNESISEKEEGITKYKLGAKYSSDFDYDGMLAMGAKAKITDGIKKLQKLYDSYEDVNYHTENENLGMAIDALKEKNKSEAKKWMDKFNEASKI